MKVKGNYISDISHLGGLKEIEQLDMDNTYPVAKESTFQLPPKGTYTLRAPDSFPSASFDRTKNGDLSIQIDPTIVGPTGEGLVVRYQKISNKGFKRGNQTVSQVGDYLAATSFSGSLKTEQDVADAVELTAGTVYQAKLDWRAYNKRTGWSLEGMERFPKNADGTHTSRVVDPAEVGKVDDTGRQLIVFANLYIPFGGFIANEAN